MLRDELAECALGNEIGQRGIGLDVVGSEL
jgi:hypothetical protein